jgi:hypothetical protein
MPLGTEKSVAVTVEGVVSMAKLGCTDLSVIAAQTMSAKDTRENLEIVLYCSTLKPPVVDQ